MKIQIQITEDITEDEVIIQCRQVTNKIQKIQQVLLDEFSDLPRLTFFKENKEYYFPLDDILFFETNNDGVYAHTASDVFRIKFRLYELEDILPRFFVRISKSNIVNLKHILVVTRNLTSSSLIQFQKTHKQVYVSRLYYKTLASDLMKGVIMSNKKWLWGTFYIGAAALLVISQLGYFADIGLFSLLFTIFLIPVIVTSITHLNFAGIFFPVALLLIIYDKPLNIERLTPWTVLIAALLLSIGCTLIVRPKKHPLLNNHFHDNWNHDHYQETVDYVEDDEVNCNVSFGSSSKYLHSTDLREAHFSCSCGSLKVFFDNTQLHSDTANIYVDCSLGSIELYLPRSWNIISNIDMTLASVEDRNPHIVSDGPTLSISGRVSLGSIVITYI